MPKTFVQSGGVRELSKIFVNDSGTVRELTKLYALDGGTVRLIFESGDITQSTGGNIFTDATHRYHLFTGSGNFVAAGEGAIEFLVIAGGGSGSPAGGGAGGLVHGSVTITPGTHAVIVGAGGTGNWGIDDHGDGLGGGQNPFPAANNGNNSSFAGFATAYMGGGGGGGNAGRAVYAGNTTYDIQATGTYSGLWTGPVGSGGGRRGDNAASFAIGGIGSGGVVGGGATSITIGGNDGGGQTGSGDDPGGGGGAGGDGNTDGTAGAGLNFAAWATATSTGNGGVYAAGGSVAGSDAGGANTGDGGDGNGFTTGNWLDGGSGVVIIRYPI